MHHYRRTSFLALHCLSSKPSPSGKMSRSSYLVYHAAKIEPFSSSYLNFLMWPHKESKYSIPSSWGVCSIDAFVCCINCNKICYCCAICCCISCKICAVAKLSLYGTFCTDDAENGGTEPFCCTNWVSGTWERWPVSCGACTVTGAITFCQPCNNRRSSILGSSCGVSLSVELLCTTRNSLPIKNRHKL